MNHLIDVEMQKKLQREINERARENTYNWKLFEKENHCSVQIVVAFVQRTTYIILCALRHFHQIDDFVTYLRIV